MYNKLSGIFLPTPKLIPVDYYKKAAEILQGPYIRELKERI